MKKICYFCFTLSYIVKHMIFFRNIQDIDQLKKHYHKLARKYHPDLGGHKGLMQKLNEEYQKKFNELNQTNETLREIQAGDIVYVNGSECIVTSALERTFIATSKITRRQALFDKYTGNCLNLKNFKASKNPSNHVN